jgi:hypothetical protein
MKLVVFWSLKWRFLIVRKLWNGKLVAKNKLKNQNQKFHFLGKNSKLETKWFLIQRTCLDKTKNCRQKLWWTNNKLKGWCYIVAQSLVVILLLLVISSLITKGKTLEIKTFKKCWKYIKIAKLFLPRWWLIAIVPVINHLTNIPLHNLSLWF